MTSITTEERRSAPLPWPATELVRVYVLDALALIALVFAWWYAGGTVRGGHELGAVAVAIGAVVASGCANALWLLVGRRSVSIRRRALRASVERLTAAIAEHAALVGAEPSVEALAATTDVVTLPRGSRYHRPGCDLVIGKQTIALTRVAATGASREPCGVCQP